MDVTVLSTKKLNVNQRELLLNKGIGLVEMNFIAIVPLKFEIGELPENLIITSKNAVKILLKHSRVEEMKQKNIFCVGEKTAVFLEKHGFRVSKMANYGANLASEIISNYKKEKFIFFCGRKRNAELPDQLKNAGVDVTEVEIYDTQLKPKKIDRSFEGVLFFSPSAVRSYCSKNNPGKSVAFCIGTTTAAEAKNFTNNIIIHSYYHVKMILK